MYCLRIKLILNKNHLLSKAASISPGAPLKMAANLLGYPSFMTFVLGSNLMDEF